MAKPNIPSVVKALPTATSSARQRLLSQPQLEEEKWYAGDVPTSSEALARIYTIGQSDPQKGQQLWEAYNTFSADPSSPFYNPYNQPTNAAISELASLGMDMSRGVGADWLEQNSWLMNHYRTGTSGTPLAPSSGSTPANNAAYWYYKVWDAEETTQRAETEWAALQEELAYWVWRPDRNYSDEEVLAKVDWSNYPTLKKMDEGRQTGVPLTLNRSIGYSQDALTGVMWAARNGGGTGNPLADSVKAALGEGKTWTQNEEITAKLDPSSDQYNPYAVGSTLDEAGLYFGMSGFDADWLEENKSLRGSNDLTARRLYAQVYEAEQLTQKAEAEYKQLIEDVNRYLSVTNDATKALGYVDMSEYPTLKKMDESLRSGDLLALTRSVPYRWQDIESDIYELCASAAAPAVPDIVSSLGKVPTTSASELAVIEAKNAALNDAGLDILETGTEGEQTVFKTSRDAGFTSNVETLTAAVTEGNTDAHAGYAKALASADAYANQNYLAALEGIRAYDQAVAAAQETKDKMDALLAEAPWLALCFSAPQAPAGASWMEIFQAHQAAPDSDGNTIYKLWLLADQLINGTPMPEGEIDYSVRAESEWDRLDSQFRTLDWSKGAEAFALREQYTQQQTEVSNLRHGYEAAQAVKADTLSRYQEADRYAAAFGVAPDREYSTMSLLDFVYPYAAEYKPTQWSSYTAYDAALMNGYSQEQVSAVAEALVPEYEAHIADLELALNELQARGIELADSYKENIEREIELTKRNLSDTRYFLIREQEDFRQVVEETRQKVVDAWSGFSFQSTRQGYSYNALLAASADERFNADGQAAVGGSVSQARWHNLMTEDELDTYLYLLGTDGPTAAEEYFDYLHNDEHGVLHTRQSLYAETAMQALTEGGWLGDTGATLLSVLVSPAKIAGSIYTGLAAFKEEEINPYNTAFLTDIGTNAIRSGVKEDINEHFGADTPAAFFANLGYDAAVGGGDSLMNTMLYGGGGAVMMGLSAMGSGARDVKLSGGDDAQAFLMGGINAAAEMLSEKASNANILELFKNPPSNGKAMLINLLWEAGKEGVSEAASELVTTVSDVLIMEELSDYSLRVDAYVTAGMSQEEAEQKALKEAIGNILYSGAVGTLSSSGTTTVSTGAGLATSRLFARPTGAQSQQQPTLPTAPQQQLETQQPQTESAPQFAPGLGVTNEPSEAAPSLQYNPVQETPAEPQKSPVLNAVAALDKARDSNNVSTITATIAASLAATTGSENPASTIAAAQALVSQYGSENTARAIHNILVESEASGLNTADVSAAISVAALTQGEARMALEVLVNGYPSVDQINELVATAQQDAVLLQDQAANVVNESMVANRTAELIAEGGMSGLRSYDSAVVQAQQNLDNARNNLQQAQLQLETTGQNLTTVSEQYLADPGNASMRGAVQQATKDVESANIVRQQMEQSVAKYETQLTEAKETRDAVRDTTLTQLREQARAEVAQLQEAARQQQEQAQIDAENQRQLDNITAVEAESFIAENGYDQLTDEQLQRVQEAVATTAQPAEVGRAAVEFAAQVSRRFGVAIRFTDSGDAFQGAYDAGSGVVLLDRNATQSDVIRKVMAHELTHRAEGSRHYGELAEALLQLRYGDDTQARQADLDAIKAKYAGVYETDADFESELVANAAEAILGNEEALSRLVAEKPSVARRILGALKSFINKMRGVKDPALDSLRRAEKLLEKSLDEVKRKGASTDRQGLQYKLQVNPKADGAEQYSYDYLTSQPDMAIATMPDPKSFTKLSDSGRWQTDKARARAEGLAGARNKNSEATTPDRLFVDNVYTDIPLQINKESLNHGMLGSRERQQRNAAAASIAGELAANAIPVNELIPKQPDKQPWVEKEYLYIALSQDSDNYYPVAMVVQRTSENLGEITHLEALDGINKRYVYSIDAIVHTKKGTGSDGLSTSQRGSTSTDSTGTGYEDMTVKNGSTSTGSTISIADLLDLVKDDFGDGFSSDVLKHLGMERPSGQFSKGVKFSLPSIQGGLEAQVQTWRNPPEAQQGGKPNRAERQFASQTAQNSQAMPEDLRQELLQNDEQHYYETDSNRAQLDRAWEQYQQEGFDACRDRILQAEHLTTDDIAMANLLMALAFRSGDVNSAMELAHRYNVEGTAQGQALQARKLFSRMTPTGARAWVAGGMETQLTEHMRTHKRQRKQIDAEAKKVADEIQDKQGGDEIARLNAAREFTIDETNNRWGIPINEQQQALIDQYKLNNVRRPGVFYNRATTKQRMLEAILATPNPLELTGNGLNLIQRLEYLKAGEAVITNADLNYIGMHLSAFAASDVDTQGSREGDLHLSRAYEAYGNITPATGREKARTWRYTSMLLSVPSALRNVIGNTTQNTINATANGIAVELDRIVSKITGERTKAHLSAAERVAGWRGFVEETQNTFRDFFLDKSITRNGEDRYNLNQRGRVFQSSLPESMRLIEGYLMSVGDRNFWKKAYINSMSEQQRVAEKNGVELNYEEAVERATAEANYATFNESNPVRDALGMLKRVPVVGDVLDFVMPFTGVPTNIVSRMWQYSPMGLATTALKHGARAATGKDFNQLDFVNGMARGLTGTALFTVGMALAHVGFLKLGTGEEDDKKVYGVESAQGKQYAPYIQVGDEYISLSAFAPAVSPFIAGAAAFDIFREDEDSWQALFNAGTAMLDQILDASYMSNLKDIFGGYGSTAENLGVTMMSSAISQNVPSVVSQLATALDPYVRDTKDKNSIVQALNAGLIQKIPGLRETLPEKVDVAGRSVESKEGLRNFFDPLTTTNAIDDPALNELMRLYDRFGVSEFFPSDALSGTKTSLTGVLGEVEGKDKETYKKRYGELWRLGGTTFDKDGNRVTLTGVTDLIQTPAYQNMSDKEKAEAIGGIVKAAKEGAVYEMGEKLGHVEDPDASSEAYEKKAVRAMPERFAQSSSPAIQRLAEMYEQTGDGAFIPKGIGRSFSRNKVEYNLNSTEYEELWSLYEAELDKALAKVDWLAPEDELAQAVESAYSSAASSAKSKYVKNHK